jgi:uncharacterized RDD family membrane protein YckC
MALFERPKPKMGTEDDVILRRVIAVIIDSIIIGVSTGIIVGVLIPSLAELGGFTILLGTFSYYIILEGEYGQTIGKVVMDITVATEEGERIDYTAAIIRTAGRMVDVLPILYFFGIVVIYTTGRKQRLGDIAAGTMVVKT